MSREDVNYKHTLRLPKTAFPMRAGLAKKEPEILQRWEKIKVYEQLRLKQDRPSYVLHDGPPYANGNLHIGHALNKILKDIVVRSQQQMGKDSRYVPGWDCHGLPIEWKIEERYRERGLEKDKVNIIELRKECREFANHWFNIQREEFRRMGVIGDWDNPYLTMDYHAETVIAEEFMKFLMNGTLYQGSKPVMWSTVEKTALAEAEVEYKDFTSPSIWVKFPINEDEVKEKGTLELPNDTQIIIWTTTPWTIPSNRAICFNPEINYSLFKVLKAPPDNWIKVNEHFLYADKLIDDFQKVARIEELKQIRPVASNELLSLVCKHPFHGIISTDEPDINRWDFQVPMIPGEHVLDETGTGFVHTAPSHGEDDYQISQKHNLSMTYNVNEDGKFRSTLPIFGGFEIFTSTGKEGAANKVVIENLISLNKLAAQKRYNHTYPHSWRSKAPLIFRNTPQWFVAIDMEINDGMDEHGKTIRERAQNSISNLVKWTPATGQSRIAAMVDVRPDWVLSRQRVWGVPLTCFVKKRASVDADDFLLKDERVNERIIEALRKEGADAWYKPGAKDRFLRGLYDPNMYEKVEDILDVWFDSGSTHSFVLRDRSDGTSTGIADLYLEGTDQHRGWFQSSLLQACGTKGRAPYKRVLTHGFTLDQDGKKMSKSDGNAMAPEKIINSHGADILRLWVAQSDYTTDLRIGPKILEQTAETYRRVRNSFRFMLGSLYDSIEVEDVTYEQMPELEKWVLHQVAELDKAVHQGYESYDFRGTFVQIANFLNLDLSRFYFDIRKDSLYCDDPDSSEHKATLKTLSILFDFTASWLAPILPFTMEEVWQIRYPNPDESVHLHDFPVAPEEWNNPDIAVKWERIREIRKLVNAEIEKQRFDKIIGSSLEAAPIVYLSQTKDIELLNSVNFSDVCITSQVELRLNNSTADKEDDSSIHVEFSKAEGEKCKRCWKILPDVGTYHNPSVCQRCDQVLKGMQVLA